MSERHDNIHAEKGANHLERDEYYGERGETLEDAVEFVGVFVECVVHNVVISLTAQFHQVFRFLQLHFAVNQSSLQQRNEHFQLRVAQGQLVVVHLLVKGGFQRQVHFQVHQHLGSHVHPPHII